MLDALYDDNTILRHVFIQCVSQYSYIVRLPVFQEGVHPDYFVTNKIGPVTEILKGVLDSGCPPVPVTQPRPYLVNFWPNFVKSPQRVQNHALGALLVAINLLNTCI